MIYSLYIHKGILFKKHVFCYNDSSDTFYSYFII